MIMAHGNGLNVHVVGLQAMSLGALKAPHPEVGEALYSRELTLRDALGAQVRLRLEAASAELLEQLELRTPPPRDADQPPLFPGEAAEG
jgi:hypothetical protein